MKEITKIINELIQLSYQTGLYPKSKVLKIEEEAKRWELIEEIKESLYNN